MKHVLVSALLSLTSVAWFLLATASGCGDSLVGLDCRSGYTRCGSLCVDLQSDALHCGSCENACASGEMCSESACVDDGDGSVDDDAGSTDMDAGDSDAARDAGEDSASADGGDDGGDGGDDSGSSDAGWADVELPPVCTGPGSPANCVCGLGQLICDQTCVNGASDALNCGVCGNDCNATPPPSGRYYCVGGQCVADCNAPLSLCGSTCIDLQRDPGNCGACGVACASGLCDLGQCLDATAGHVIVIGHDMSSALPATRRLAGNAIFLPAKQMIRGLVYEERSAPAARAGVQSAINEMTSITGRVFSSTKATSALSVPFLLSQVDVFVIVAQANARDDVLLKNAESWSRALRAFVLRGGVIVLFDGGGNNKGTYQLLVAAGLFSAVERIDLSPRTVNIVAPGDALASFVSTRYQAQNQTVGFDTSETTVVVRDLTSGLPVVIHIAR